MKITETNTEQWDIKESGVTAIVIGAIVAIGGVTLSSWTLTHPASLPWWWTLVGAGLFVVGGLIIFSASKRQITLRRQGASEVVTTKLIGGKQTRLSFDADQIVSVNLETSDVLKTENNGQDQTTTRERSSLLYVLLNDNSQVMLATAKRSGGNGVSINGFDLSGVSKAPLTDEAQRIATFFGVPLNSRANNMNGAQAVGSVINTVQQGIASAQQPAVITNAQPVTQSSPVVVVPPAVPVVPVMPIGAPVQNDTVATPSPVSETENTGEQPLR